MTKTDLAIALLNERPELANDRKAVAEHIGCSPRTAKRYIIAWEGTRHIVWALDRVTDCRMCDQCDRRHECELLSELALVPMLCERVTEEDVELAELRGLALEVVDGREWIGGE